MPSVACELREFLRETRRLQAAVASLVTRIGIKADEQARAGRSAPAREFLLDDGRVSAETARQEAKRSALADRFPSVADHLSVGKIGADQLDSLARRTRRLTDEQCARLPAERVLRDATRLPADTFDTALRRLVEGVTADDRTGRDDLRRASEFRHWFDPRSGMGKIFGSFDPERYEALTSAVDAHVTALAGASEDEPVTKDANLAAEALVQLVTTTGPGRPSPAPVTVVVDHQTLATGHHSGTVARTGDGHTLAPSALARLCCDAVLRRVVHDGAGVPINVGRRHRTATAAQWDAIRSLHTSCAWPGCSLPLRWTQLHHITEWKDGGSTDLNNLVPLCHRHHHRVHEGGWSIRLGADRSVSTYLPDGRSEASTGAPNARGEPKWFDSN